MRIQWARCDACAPTIDAPRPPVDPARLITAGELAAICDAEGITVRQMRDRDRTKAAMAAKKRVAFVLRSRGLSYTEIGVLMKRDHTSVMSLVKGPRRRAA